MALLFGADRGDLFRNKATVQVIFNSDYQFAKAPLKPNMRAVEGDGVVTLYWDRVAEGSFDPLYGLDFEGYVIYKSTEPSFSSPEVKSITDMFGIPTLRKPVAQFDIFNGIVGEDPIGVNGAHFNRGSDSGLQHTWVDTNVKNGQTYYYTVVSYDRGYHQGLRDEVDLNEEFDDIRESIPLGLLDVAVAESPSVIQLDEAGNITGFDINTAGATPRVPAAGFIAARVDTLLQVGGPGTGDVVAEILDGPQMLDRTYEVTFTDDGDPFRPVTTTYTLRDANTGELLIDQSIFVFPEDESPVVDGFRLRLLNPNAVALIPEESGWREGASTNWNVAISDPPTTNKTLLAADLEVRFADSIVDTSISGLGGRRTPVNFQVWDITNDARMEFRFNDRDRDGAVSIGDEIRPIVLDEDGVQLSVWDIRLGSPDDPNVAPVAPSAGDLIRVQVAKPFRRTDVFQFRTVEQRVDNEIARGVLGDIYVVPNPYIATSTIEPSNNFRIGRGERRIAFVNLPSVCTIKIFSASGALVETIEHNTSADDGSAFWDLRSKEGLDVAFGYYFYIVEAPDVGTAQGKFALIK